MSDRDTKRIDERPPDGSSHEHRDVNVRMIVLSAIVLAGILIALQPLLMWLVGYFQSRARRFDVPVSPLASPEQPHPPLLQSNPQLDLRALQGRDQAILNSYGWIDRKHDVVRIPIDRAMELLVERGLPPVDKQPVPPVRREVGPPAPNSAAPTDASTSPKKRAKSPASKKAGQR